MATWDDATVTWDDIAATWDDSRPGTHSVRVVLAGQDITGSVLSNTRVVIRKGRANSTVQPDPNTCVLAMVPQDEPPKVGESLAVTVNMGGLGYYAPAFTGFITDVVCALAADGRTVAQIVAVSDGLGRMGRLRVGSTPWPVETDGARIGRILAACADSGVIAGTVDAGTITFLGRDVDAQNPADLARKYAAEALGMLVDGRDGAVGYHDAYHRDSTNGAPTDIDAGEILTLPTAAMRVGSVINKVAIRYGQEPQAEYVAEDTQSIAAYGPLDVSATTELSATSDARTVGDNVIALFSSPRWGAESITVPVHRLTSERAAIIGNIEPSRLLRIYGMPLPMPNPFLTWVESIEDSYSYDTWERVLIVSDRWMTPTGPVVYEWLIDPLRDISAYGPAVATRLPEGWDDSGIALTYNPGSETATLKITKAKPAVQPGNAVLTLSWPAVDSPHPNAAMDWQTFHTGETEKPLIVYPAGVYATDMFTLQWNPYDLPATHNALYDNFDTGNPDVWRQYSTQEAFSPAPWNAAGFVYAIQPESGSLISMNSPAGWNMRLWDGITRPVRFVCRWRLRLLSGAPYEYPANIEHRLTYYPLLSDPVSGFTEVIDLGAFYAGTGDAWQDYSSDPFQLSTDYEAGNATIVIGTRFTSGTGFIPPVPIYELDVDYMGLVYADDLTPVTAGDPGPTPGRPYGQWVAGRTYPETFDALTTFPPVEPVAPDGRWELSVEYAAGNPVNPHEVQFSQFTSGFIEG